MIANTAPFRTMLGALCCAAAALLAPSTGHANPNPDEPTIAETIRLPHYCQAQLARNPVGQIPSSCGVFMNHFCYALNFLNRANDFSLPKDKRLWNARRARTDLEYTKKGMLAGCPIRQDVEAADMRLRAIEMFVK